MSNIFLGIGVGPGIGLHTAIRFAREGFQPVLVSRSMANLRPLADTVRRETGRQAEIVALDALDGRQIASLGERLGENVRVLHYNAAARRPLPLHESTLETLRDDIQVNITGALAAVKVFSPQMIARKSGTILLTGGGFALSPSGEYLTLSIGKAGIRCMSRALFPEMAAHNVHIASLTVTRHIEPDTEEPREVADMFWNMHQQPAEAWTWEEKYP